MTTRDPAGMNRYGWKCVRSDWGMAKQDRKDANAAHATQTHAVDASWWHPIPPGGWEFMKPVAGKAPKWPLQH